MELAEKYAFEDVVRAGHYQYLASAAHNRANEIVSECIQKGIPFPNWVTLYRRLSEDCMSKMFALLAILKKRAELGNFAKVKQSAAALAQRMMS